MNKPSKDQQFSGFGWILFLITATLSAPLLYFIIQLMLGNERLFLEQGLHY
ncbi:hypothetical protein [Paenibacillus senegalensis]|uniref:hypothetical protein n=1 Tax=Paenibacillus senegalensis TaxID=1465766 RepID=UPI0002F74FDF|nr:hypothetical protein [Paenibacillus senegalensis]